MSASPTGKRAGPGRFGASGAAAKTKATTRPQRSGPGSSGRNRMSFPTSHWASRSRARTSRSGSPAVGRGGSTPAVLSRMPLSRVNSEPFVDRDDPTAGAALARAKPVRRSQAARGRKRHHGPCEKNGEAKARPGAKANFRAREAVPRPAPKRANVPPLSFAWGVPCRTHLRSQPHGTGFNRFRADEYSKGLRERHVSALRAPLRFWKRRWNATGRRAEPPPMPLDRRAFRSTRRRLRGLFVLRRRRPAIGRKSIDD
jgi:hypothetical protein